MARKTPELMVSCGQVILVGNAAKLGSFGLLILLNGSPSSFLGILIRNR